MVSDLLNRYDPETKRRQAAQTPQPKPKPKPKPMPRPQQPPQQPPPQPPHPSYPMPPTPIVRAELPMPSVTPSTPKGDPTLRTPLTYVMPVPKLHNPTPLPPTPGNYCSVNTALIDNVDSSASLVAAGQRKGFIDKMVDFLVGDGPEYSVAVTCKQCSAYYANLPKEEVPYARRNTHFFVCLKLNPLNPLPPFSSPNPQSLRVTTVVITMQTGPAIVSEGSPAITTGRKRKERTKRERPQWLRTEMGKESQNQIIQMDRTAR